MKVHQSARPSTKKISGDILHKTIHTSKHVERIRHIALQYTLFVWDFWLLVSEDLM